MSKTKEKYLGTIRSKIVGLQYCDAELRPGEKIYFEREPNNRYDPNAILAKNEDHEKTGYLPREEAFWLAPLLDSGKLIINAAIDQSRAMEDYQAPLNLGLTLASKGSKLLRPYPGPKDKPQALHNTILAALAEAQSWNEPELLLAVADKYSRLLSRSSLPETYLAHKMFFASAANAGKRKAAALREAVQNSVQSLGVGKALYHDGVTLFPLYNGGKKPVYSLLDQAIKSGEAIVTEVSEGGSVGNLKVTNKGARPILIPEGEIIIGGKQNRTVNITVIIEAYEEYLLPVSCVEQGRWKYQSDTFRAYNWAPPSLRHNKMKSVRRSTIEDGELRSDQHEVWNDVAMNLDYLEARSETGSITAGYEAIEKRTRLYLEKLKPDKKAVGMIVGFGGKAIGMDFFDAPATFDKLWERLANGYLIQCVSAAEAPKKRTVKKSALDLIRAATLSLKLEEHEGTGIRCAFDSEELAGDGIVYQDSIRHLAVFPKPESAS